MTNVVTKEVWTKELPWLDRDDADIDGYVERLVAKPDYDLAQKLRDWKENGVVIFEQAVPIDLIDQYLDDISHLIKNFGDYDIPLEIRSAQISSRDVDQFLGDMTGVKLNQMHCFSKAAAKLSIVPILSDFLGHLFNGPASVCQSLTFWRGSEQRIHIDYPYVRQQTKLSYLAASWIPLEDVAPNSGPLAYYPGGHRIERSGFFDWGDGSIIFDEHSVHTPSQFADYLENQMTLAGIAPKIFCPKKGDVLIWHGNLPHEGTRVNDPALTRKSYVTHYTAEETLPGWMRHFDASGRPVGVFENGAYSYRYPWFDQAKTLPSWDQR